VPKFQSGKFTGRGIGLLRILSLGLLAASILPACQSSARVSAENDRLRKLTKQQETQLAALKGEVAELNIKLAEASRENRGLAPDALDALPRVTKVEISTLSGFLPLEGAQAGKVIVWFETQDGRARFVQAVGTVSVEALALSPAVGEVTTPPSERIGSASLSSRQLRDAYRSGLTGTHYAVELPLAKPTDKSGKTLVIRVELHDALTGQVLKAERVISPRPAPQPSSAQAG